jgi:hypothetical protein
MPQVAHLFATLSLTRQTLILFVDKGLITREEAAAVFMRSADEVRSATKAEASPEFGETIAKSIETHVVWFLRYRFGGP